jgi:hypothetical protein
MTFAKFHALFLPTAAGRLYISFASPGNGLESQAAVAPPNEVSLQVHIGLFNVVKIGKV